MKRIIILLALLSFTFFACENSSDEAPTYVTNTIAFTWKGTLATAPTNPEIGWAYYNTTKKASYYWDGSSWQLMVQDGTDGVGIVWKGELSSAPLNPQVNWAYYNRVDGNSYIWNGAKWDYLAKSGRDGATGILLWLGSFENAPENPSDGWAYYNENDCISYIYSNGSWQVLAKDGTNGSDGSSIIWKGVLSSAPEFPEINWAYYNSSEQVSYIWNGASWDILAVSLGGDTTVTVSITWLGSFSAAPVNPLIGYAYYNTAFGASYVYDGSVWQQISKDGADGTNGTGGTATVTGYLITWKGSYAASPSSPQAGWAYYNTTAKKSYIYDGTTWQIMAQDGINGENGSSTGSGADASYVYIKTETETIDGIEYVVKHYADVYTPEPYFYTYYKFYYLNGTLRRTYNFYHSVGSCLDYPYTSFAEHKCGTSVGSVYIATYDESGDLVSYIQNFDTSRQEYYFENNIKVLWKNYSNNILYVEYSYWTNGNNKFYVAYNTSTGLKKSEMHYDEKGRTLLTISYNVDESVSSKTEYTYYENGQKATEKGYSGEILTTYYEYYENGNEKERINYNTDGSISRQYRYYETGSTRIDIRYNTDGTVDAFAYYYSTGYIQYYYTDSGYLYTYDDGKTKSSSTSTSYYSSKTAYTEEDVKTLIAELE